MDGFTSALLGDDSNNAQDANANQGTFNSGLFQQLSFSSPPTMTQVAIQQPGQQISPVQQHVQQQPQQQFQTLRPQQMMPPQQQVAGQQQLQPQQQFQPPVRHQSPAANQAQRSAAPRTGQQPAASSKRLSPAALFQALESSGVIRTPQQRQAITQLKMQLTQMKTQGVQFNPIQFRGKLQEIIPKQDLQKFLHQLHQRSGAAQASAGQEQKQAQSPGMQHAQQPQVAMVQQQSGLQQQTRPPQQMYVGMQQAQGMTPSANASFPGQQQQQPAAQAQAMAPAPQAPAAKKKPPPKKKPAAGAQQGGAPAIQKLSVQQILGVQQAYQQLSHQRHGLLQVPATQRTPQQIQDLQTCEKKLKVSLGLLIKHMPQVKDLAASLKTTQPQLAATLQHIVNQHEDTYNKQVAAAQEQQAKLAQQQGQDQATAGTAEGEPEAKPPKPLNKKERLKLERAQRREEAEREKQAKIAAGLIKPKPPRKRPTKAEQAARKAAKEASQAAAEGTGQPGADATAASAAKSPAVKGAKRPAEGAPDKTPVSKKAAVVATTEKDMGQDITEGGDVLEGTGVNIDEEAGALRSLTDGSGDGAHQEVEEDRMLNKGPLMQRLSDLMRRNGVSSCTPDMEHFLNLAVETHLSGILRKMCYVARQRLDVNRRAPGTVITSDMRRNVLSMQRQDQERERERLLLAEKQKDQAMKANEKLRGRVEEVLKEEEVKRVSAAANEAARSAFGKAKWMSFLKKKPGKDKLKSGKDGSPKKTDANGGSSKEKDVKPPLPGLKPTTKDAVAPAAAASSLRPSSTGKTDDKARTAMDAAGSSGKAADGEATGAAGPVGIGLQRSLTLPPSRMHQTGLKLTVQDLITVMERDPGLAKSTRLPHLYMMTN